jgi:hypothetical protein
MSFSQVLVYGIRFSPPTDSPTKKVNHDFGLEASGSS